MKRVEGIIYTRDMGKLAAVLESMGLIVHEIVYDGRRTVSDGISEGIACIYDLLNRVKIRTVISDERVGTMMETLRSFGNCEFVIIPEEQFCLV
jgi:nitrogen regulatory protein PII